MADAGDKISRKREWEPISMVCLVVLLIAGAAVLCTYVNEHYIQDDKETVEYGDTVTIDYTGSLYTYYNKSDANATALIFDTTKEKVATDDDYIFISGFDAESKTLEATSITLGQHKFLEAFENAIIGHDVGETVYIHIDANDAYHQANQNKIADSADSATYFDLTTAFNMTTAQYKAFFGTEAPANSTFDYDKIKDASGNPIKVSAVTSGDTVIVSFNITDGTYTVKEIANYGKLTMTVSGSKYYLSVENPIYVKDSTVETSDKVALKEIEMLTFDTLYGTHINVIGSEGSKIIYNNGENTAALYNMDLYFVVKIVSKD